MTSQSTRRALVLCFAVSVGLGGMACATPAPAPQASSPAAAEKMEKGREKGRNVHWGKRMGKRPAQTGRNLREKQALVALEPQVQEPPAAE